MVSIFQRQRGFVRTRARAPTHTRARAHIALTFGGADTDVRALPQADGITLRLIFKFFFFPLSERVSFLRARWKSLFVSGAAAGA